MQSLYDILMLLLQLAIYLVFAHVIMSWLINFQVLNLRQPFVAQIWFGLQRVLEPIYGPIRKRMPHLGGVDLTPIVVLIGIQIIMILLSNNRAFFS